MGGLIKSIFGDDSWAEENDDARSLSCIYINERVTYYEEDVSPGIITERIPKIANDMEYVKRQTRMERGIQEPKARSRKPRGFKPQHCRFPVTSDSDNTVLKKYGMKQAKLLTLNSSYRSPAKM